jgi:hypothetical protein
MEKDNNSLDILWKIKRNLQQEKRAFNYPDIDINFFKKIRLSASKKRYKGKNLSEGFSAVGLVIADENCNFEKTVESWYGYTIIKSRYYRELTWMMIYILGIVNQYFRGMEAREYLYDHLAERMKNSLKRNSINIVFRDLLHETDRLINEAIIYESKKKSDV